MTWTSMGLVTMILCEGEEIRKKKYEWEVA